MFHSEPSQDPRAKQTQDDIRFQKYRLSVVKGENTRRAIANKLALLRDELFQVTRQPWQERRTM